jgi:hypothetical protein
MHDPHCRPGPFHVLSPNAPLLNADSSALARSLPTRLTGLDPAGSTSVPLEIAESVGFRLWLLSLDVSIVSHGGIEFTEENFRPEALSTGLLL